jgi:hypothetical protein
LENTYKEDIAAATGDWRGAAQCAAKSIEVERIRYELETERNKALEALNEALSACGNIPQDGKSYIENFKREVEMYRQSTERQLKAAVLAGYDGMARTAFNAGDVGTYERAQNERIKVLTQPEDKDTLSSVYAQMAQDLVTLTGDRTKGDELSDKAMQLDAEARPDKAETRRRYYDQRGKRGQAFDLGVPNARHSRGCRLSLSSRVTALLML